MLNLWRHIQHNRLKSDTLTLSIELSIVILTVAFFCYAECRRAQFMKEITFSISNEWPSNFRMVKILCEYGP